MLNGNLYETTDAGLNWTMMNSKSLTKCKNVVFAIETVGWALRNLWNSPKRSNTVLATHDAGASWKKVLEVPTPIYSVDFLNENVGFVSSRFLPLQRTAYGGKSWEEIDGIEGLHYVFFIDETKGWAMLAQYGIGKIPAKIGPA